MAQAATREAAGREAAGREAATHEAPRAVLNPLRSEDEAFRFLLYVIAVVAVIIGVVLLLRAAL
jgi:hypothetical protein